MGGAIRMQVALMKIKARMKTREHTNYERVLRETKGIKIEHNKKFSREQKIFSLFISENTATFLAIFKP
jgi:hypothetical protein